MLVQEMRGIAGPCLTISLKLHIPDDKIIDARITTLAMVPNLASCQDMMIRI